MMSRGISPFLAYDIVLKYMPEASVKLHLPVLEAVAKVDRANALVTRI